MLIFKVFGGLAGAVAIAVPVSMGVTATYKESALSDFQREIEDLKGRCFVIPTKDTVANSQIKFLICNSQHLFSSHNSEYLLWNRNGNGTKASVARIKKDKDQLKISWEDFSATDQLLTGETSLKISENNLENIGEGIDLKSACHFLSDVAEKGGPQWQCNDVSSSGDGGEIKIPLTKFLG